MTPQQSVCPNCGRPADGAALYCPNCGAMVPEHDIWPPAPDGQIQPVVQPDRLKTGTVLGDVLFGILTAAGLFFFWCTGILTVPLVYSWQRQRWPVYARAMGWTYVVVMAYVGAAFVSCMTGTTRWHP